jgi:hypothetical protein
MHAQATMHTSARLSPHNRQLAFRSSAPSQPAPRYSYASSRPHAFRQAVGGRQTDCAPATSAQLDRRSLLLGVVGSQLLWLSRLQSALADEVPEITTVSGMATACWVCCAVLAGQKRGSTCAAPC